MVSRGILSDVVSQDADISIFTLDSDEGLEIMRHTVAAQVLARAIKNLYPKAKLAIGPTIQNGFYYDFLSDKRVSIDDLPKIEKEMQKIVAEKSDIAKTIHSKEEAIKNFADIKEDYKVKIIEESEQEDNFQLYNQGDTGFIDLCRGPHLPSLDKLEHLNSRRLLVHTGKEIQKMKCSLAYMVPHGKMKKILKNI
jgi:threonyl-tRNA synthetase